MINLAPRFLSSTYNFFLQKNCQNRHQIQFWPNYIIFTKFHNFDLASNRLYPHFVYKCFSWCFREIATALVVILRWVWPEWDSTFKSYEHFQMRQHLLHWWFAKFSILSSASLDGFSVLFKIYFIGDTLPLACLWREVGMGRYHNIITLLLSKSWLHNQSRLFPTFSLFPLFRLSSSNVYYTMPALTLRLKPNWTLF